MSKYQIDSNLKQPDGKKIYKKHIKHPFIRNGKSEMTPKN
jgi:hypothetical protein